MIALLTRGFEEGTDYPTVRLEASLQAGGSTDVDDGVGQMASKYFEIDASGSVTITLDGSALEGVLVDISSQQAQVNLFTAAITVDADEFDSLYLIVLNLACAEDEAECSSIPYTVGTEAGNGAELSVPAHALHAPNFEPPRVGEPYDLDDDWYDDEEWLDDEEWFEDEWADDEWFEDEGCYCTGWSDDHEWLQDDGLYDDELLDSENWLDEEYLEDGGCFFDELDEEGFDDEWAEDDEWLDDELF